MASEEGPGGDGGDVVLVQVQVLQLAQLVQRARWNLSGDSPHNIFVFDHLNLLGFESLPSSDKA